MRVQTELELLQLASGVRWLVAHMPFDARAEFGSGGIIRVHGTANGFPFHSSIFPHRSGHHYLIFNKKMREGAQVSEPGEPIEITLDLDRAPKTVKIPPALRKALDANPAAKKFFDDLPPSSQRYRAEMVNDVKTAAGKAKKIDAIVKHMADTGTALQKTPDWVMKGLAKTPVAKERWLKLSRSHKRMFLIYLMDGKAQTTRERRVGRITRMLLANKTW